MSGTVRGGKPLLGFRLPPHGHGVRISHWASLSLSVLVGPVEGMAPASPLPCEQPTGECPPSQCVVEAVTWVEGDLNMKNECSDENT